MTRAPLRFLLTVLALWIGVRAAVLLPGGIGGIVRIPAAAAEPPRMVRASPATAASAAPASPSSIPVLLAGQIVRPDMPDHVNGEPAIMVAAGTKSYAPAPPPSSDSGSPPSTAAPQPIAFSPAPPVPGRAPSSRWSASAWLLVRDESGGAALAPGGTLGASQAGARLLYAVGHGVALSGRVYLPRRRAS